MAVIGFQPKRSQFNPGDFPRFHSLQHFLNEDPDAVIGQTVVAAINTGAGFLVTPGLLIQTGKGHELLAPSYTPRPSTEAKKGMPDYALSAVNYPLALNAHLTPLPSLPLLSRSLRTAAKALLGRDLHYLQLMDPDEQPLHGWRTLKEWPSNATLHGRDVISLLVLTTQDFDLDQMVVMTGRFTEQRRSSKAVSTPIFKTPYESFSPLFFNNLERESQLVVRYLPVWYDCLDNSVQIS